MADSRSQLAGNRVTLKSLAKQLLPPLLLLPLFFLQFELFTSLYWLAGGIAACGALWNLLRMAWGFLRSRRQEWFVALRPGLTILLIGAAATTMGLVSAGVAEEADQLGRTTAAQMQEACRAQGICPGAPPGWELAGDRARKAVRFMSVEYSLNSKASEFTVRVRHRMENELLIHGGATVPLREEIALK